MPSHLLGCPEPLEGARKPAEEAKRQTSCWLCPACSQIDGRGLPQPDWAQLRPLYLRVNEDTPVLTHMMQLSGLTGHISPLARAGGTGRVPQPTPWPVLGLRLRL